MKVRSFKKLATVAAAASAIAMMLAGCGASGANQAEGAAEPEDGFAVDYKGAYPMPDATKRYDNHKEYDQVKDGGTLNLATTYTPNWNYMSVEGNTGYMSELWGWYMPVLATLDVKGNITWNTDYVTKVETVSEKPLVVKFTLNDKAKWNDGSDITWKDYEATWQISNGKSEDYTPASTEGWDKIESIKAGDTEKEAVVTFSEPFYTWPALFTGLFPHQSLGKKNYESWQDNPHTEWAAGPFTVQSADKDSVTFVRNPKWWGKKAKLEKVVYKYMEQTAQLNAFKNSEIDSFQMNSNAEIQSIKSRKDTQIRIGYGTKVRVLNINAKADNLKDINVRKAIVYALDRDQIAKVQFQGMNWKAETPGSELFPVFQEGYENNLPEDSRKVNVDLAKKTLEDAGYKLGSDGYYAKDGKTVTVKYTYFGTDPTTKAVAQAIQALEKKAGIKIELDNQGEDKFAAVVTSMKFEILPMAWQSPSPYSQTNVSQLYGQNSSSNFTGYGSAEVDELAKVPGTIADQVEAVHAANKAEKKALEGYATTTTVTPPNMYAVKKGLANYGPAGFASNLPETIGFAK